MVSVKANLTIRSFDNSEDLSVGKVVPYKSLQIVHCDVFGKYQRHSQAAWGVRAPVLKMMNDNEIVALYLWDKATGITYSAMLSQFKSSATPGQPDKFGGTLNLPKDMWMQFNGKLSVPWVPDVDRLILQAVGEPWEMPRAASSRVTVLKTTRPVAETLAMF